MEFFLKASTIIIIFYSCYKLFLQSDTFFEWSRVFLLVGLGMSFMLPFWIIPVYVEYAPITIEHVEPLIVSDGIISDSEQQFNLWDYIPVVYLLGVATFTLRFLVHAISLGSILFISKKRNYGKFKLLETKSIVAPFSFFKWIVYNPDQFDAVELEQILIHEKVHARQYHSIDVLVSQLACIILWFNPFVWLYAKDIKQNLEFIADKNAQRELHCKKSYQYTLLKASMAKQEGMALSNNFYNSLIKKRIIMLQKTKSKKRNLFKYALVLPLLAIFLMSFNTEEVYIEDSTGVVTKTEKENDEFIISGKVMLDNKEGLEKVMVVIEDKQRGAMTDADGNFKIKVAIGDKITFSRKHFTTKEFQINSKEAINIILRSVSGLFIDSSNGKKPVHYYNGKKISQKEFRSILQSKVKKVKTSLISGVVYNEEGQPLAGATILNGTTTAVMTNAAGEYTIKAEKGDELVYSFKNMKSQKITVKNKKIMNVNLTNK